MNNNYSLGRILYHPLAEVGLPVNGNGHNGKVSNGRRHNGENGENGERISRNGRNGNGHDGANGSGCNGNGNGMRPIGRYLTRKEIKARREQDRLKDNNYRRDFIRKYKLPISEGTFDT